MAEVKKNTPSKTWRWTLNNYTEKDIELHKTWSTDCKRMRVAKEVGSVSGIPHLQCFATFNRAMRFSALKKMHPRCHWEIAKVKDALYEAKHDGEIIIDIDNRKQGKRNDIINMCDDIGKGASKQELWKNHPETMIKFYKGAYEMMSVVQMEDVCGLFKLCDFPWTPISYWETCHILWGKAGIGKTQFALAHFKCALLISHIDALKTFDPARHDGIIFDDMAFTHLPKPGQIHLLDIDHPRDIHIRYGIARIPANTKKVFTTNVYEGEIFDLSDDAILRRVTVTEVTKR